MPNLQKVFWLALGVTLLLWLGVGIYYLKSTRFASVPAVPPPEGSSLVSPQPTGPVIANQFDEVEFIVGNFQGWEEIEGSPDRYILLVDSDTGQPFPKIRVGFELSPLYGFGGEDITVFAVEKAEEDYDVLYALKYFTDEEIDKLIKKNDPIKIYLQWKLEKEENVKDEKGNLVAHWLLIKRIGGKAEVERELGREIKKPERQ